MKKKQSTRNSLISIYEDSKKRGGPDEGTFLLIDNLLIRNQDCVDVFIELFTNPKESDDKSVLAHIILTTRKFQPAIDYLESLEEDDFTGYSRSNLD